MADGPLRRNLTRRRVVLGATALAVSALAARGETATTDTPALVATAPEVRPTPLIVFAGASVTAGLGVRRSEAFPARTIALLAPAAYDAVTVAVSGRTVHTVAATAPTEIDPLYDPHRAGNTVVLYAGLNDLCAGAGIDETLARLAAFAQGRRRVGFTVVLGTLLPSTVDPGPGESYEARRQRVNERLRADTARFADALADLGADPMIGSARRRRIPHTTSATGSTRRAQGMTSSPRSYTRRS